MKNHPIYNNDDIITHSLVKCLSNKDKLKEVLELFQLRLFRRFSSDEIAALVNKAVIYKEIINNNHNLIKINNKDEWESDITKKTLEKLTLKDFNFSFKSGTVVYDNYQIFFAYLTGEEIVKKYSHLANIVGNKNIPEKGFIHIIYNNKNDITTNIYYCVNDMDTIFSKDGIDNEMTDEQKNVITTLLSILLYAGMFKNVNDRVKITTIIGKKSSKHQIPKHNINQISLFQKVSNEEEIKSREGSSWKSNKRWLVRGHLRNQFYKSTGEYKIIFIDPFWKGEGIEEVEKIYNI